MSGSDYSNRAAKMLGVDVVTGFTGSPVWHMLYRFPPTSDEQIEAGYKAFADRWNPIIDVFEKEGVRFALEAHPALQTPLWANVQARQGDAPAPNTAISD